MLLVWVAISACFFALIVTAIIVLGLSKRLQHSEQQALSKITELKKELDLVSRAAIGVGQRLLAVEKKLNISIEKQQRLESNHSDHQPYNYAASLAENGATAEQLIDSCGLPEAEASLMALLKHHVAGNESRLRS